MLSVMQLNSRIRLRGELALGRQELNAKFDSSPPRILRSGELLAVAVGSRVFAGEGLLTEPIAGAQLQWRELVFMPQSRPSLSSI